MSSKYFFLTSTKLAHSRYVWLWQYYYMLHKQEAFLFSKERNVWNRSDQYVVYLKLSFLLLQSFGKMSWRLLDTMITSSHSFCQTFCIYLAVKGFRSEKGIRSSVGSFSRASLAALSAASFPWIPTCQETHVKKTTFFRSVSILCSISCICVNGGWSLFSSSFFFNF